MERKREREHKEGGDEEESRRGVGREDGVELRGGDPSFIPAILFDKESS